jgi:hypothetical protein
MKKKLSLIALVVFMLAFTAWQKQGSFVAPKTPNIKNALKSSIAAKLLFKSDFNMVTPATTIISTYSLQKDAVTGTNQPNYNWNIFSPSAGSGIINYEGGTNADRTAVIANDDNSTDGVLKFTLYNGAIVDPFNGIRKGRVQLELYNFKNEGVYLDEYYQKVKMKLDKKSFNTVLNNSSRLVDGSGDWINFFEVFDGVTDFSHLNDAAFRVGMMLKKVTNGSGVTHLVMVLTGERGKNGGGWDNKSLYYLNQDPTETPLYINPGSWYTYEIYIKRGTGEATGNGRFWLKITDNTNPNTKSLPIAHYGSMTLANATTSPRNTLNDGFRYICPLKMYASNNVIQISKPLQICFSYWECWTTRPY